jgi:hypothetical protein
MQAGRSQIVALTHRCGRGRFCVVLVEDGLLSNRLLVVLGLD